jgi:S1-C subfamily serine protease
MKKRISGSVLVVLLVSLLAPNCPAKNTVEHALKQQERYTLSLELEFSKKNPTPLQRVMTFLDWGPNGYATGFLVGDGLLMTAYHVVSGALDDYKKIALGFSAGDQLDVRVYANGCQARVLSVDKEADLALLEICGSSKRTKVPAFQSILSKDEKLLLIARPHGDNIVRQGTLFGSTTFNGLEYWSVKMNARDGFSGSPVYNQKAELVGVMSGYDRSQKLALISPGTRAQKLLEDYISSRK